MLTDQPHCRYRIFTFQMSCEWFCYGCPHRNNSSRFHRLTNHFYHAIFASHSGIQKNLCSSRLADYQFQYRRYLVVLLPKCNGVVGLPSAAIENCFHVLSDLFPRFDWLIVLHRSQLQISFCGGVASILQAQFSSLFRILPRNPRGNC